MPGVLGLYARLEETTGRMLPLAEALDWSALAALETERSALAQQVATVDPRQLSADEAAALPAIIERILARQTEVEAMVSPWLEQTRLLLRETHQEKSLLAAYKAAE